MSKPLSRLTAAAFAVAALAGPASAATAAIPSDQQAFPGRGIAPVTQDVRSPDARQAGETVSTAATQAPGATAVSSATDGVVAPPGTDLRTPDARDGTRVTAPDVPAAKAPVSVPADDGGDLTWAQITLGAAALFLLAGMAVTGRRRHSPTPA